MLYKLTLLLSITLYNILDFVIASPESTQLALAQKQLDGVKTSLERAQTSASTDPPVTLRLRLLTGAAGSHHR